MEQQEIKKFVEEKISELNQMAMQSSQNMKEGLETKLAYAEEFMAKLNNSKEILENQIKENKTLLSDLEMPLDLNQELSDFEASLTQEDGDIEKLTTDFQHLLEEVANAQLNARKAKVLFAKEEMEAKLIAAKESLGSDHQAVTYTQKVLSFLKDKLGHRLKKNKNYFSRSLRGVCNEIKSIIYLKKFTVK